MSIMDTPDNTGTNPAAGIWKRFRVQIVIGLVVAIGAGTLLTLIWHNNISNDGRVKQRNVVTLQRNIELEISTCLDTGATAAQVAQQEFTMLKDLLTNVVAARYVDPANPGDPTRADAAIGGGAFISALQEQYPQIDTSTWKTLMGIVVDCRKDVQDRQERLQIFAGEFDNWRQTGGIFSKYVRNNFPSDKLSTIDRQTGERLYGEEALEYLTRVISIKAAQDTMRTGTLPDQNLFGGNQPPASTAPAAPSPSATK